MGKQVSNIKSAAIVLDPPPDDNTPKDPMQDSTNALGHEDFLLAGLDWAHAGRPATNEKKMARTAARFGIS